MGLSDRVLLMLDPNTLDLLACRARLRSAARSIEAASAEILRLAGDWDRIRETRTEALLQNLAEQVDECLVRGREPEPIPDEVVVHARPQNCHRSETVVAATRMKMSEVRVGMRFKNVFGGVSATVTELTERGFKYSLDSEVPWIPRWGMSVARDGGEHFGFNGDVMLEPEVAVESNP